MTIPVYALRALEQIASLAPGDLTAVGPVIIGTDAARTILSSLDAAETLQAVRALVDGGKVTPGTLRALLATSGVETVEIRKKVTTP